MSDRMLADTWPYGETPEAAEARVRRRRWLVEVAGVVLTFAGAVAAWQGLAWFAVATYAAA